MTSGAARDRRTRARTRAALVAAWLAVATPARASYREIAVTDGGRLAGRVRVTGPVPTLPPSPVYREQSFCGTTMPDQRLVVDATGGVANAVVHLVGVEAGKAIPKMPVVLDNRRCAFVPHVVAGSVGQTLEIRNADPFLHDAHAILGPRTLFNVAILKNRTVRRPLLDAGVSHVNCNLLHTWMHAWLFVTEEPYVVVTGPDGRWALDDVPSGTYRLAVWHEMLGDRERDVTIAPGRELHVDVDLPSVAPNAP
jgi:plastocyanin